MTKLSWRGNANAPGAGTAFLPVIITAVIAGVLPLLWFQHDIYVTGLAVTALVFAGYGAGFNLIFGATNQLFLCVGALASIGGYAVGLLSQRESVPIVPGVVIGTLAAALVGGLLSWVAVRRSLDVIFTGIVTLAFSLGLNQWIIGQQGVTNGTTGIQLTRAATGLADDRLGGYYMFAAAIVVFLIVFRALQLSRAGWAFRALKDDETAAELAGVNVARYRIYAAVVGSAMIGLTGALYAYSSGFISPGTFEFDQIDVQVLVIVAFGGLGTLLSPVIGATVFAFINYGLSTSGQLREMLYGAFIVALFLGFRRGAVQTVVDVARRLMRPRGVPVKSPQAPGSTVS